MKKILIIFASLFLLTGMQSAIAQTFIEFESFGPDDQGKKFGIDLDAKYDGLTWAYPLEGFEAKFQLINNGVVTQDSGWVPLVHGYDWEMSVGSGTLQLNIANNLQRFDVKCKGGGGPCEFAGRGKTVKVTFKDAGGFADVDVLGVGPLTKTGCGGANAAICYSTIGPFTVQSAIIQLGGPNHAWAGRKASLALDVSPVSSKIVTWGSFSVEDAGASGGNDSEGNSIPGHGFSDNWLKARAGSIGKGAKINRCEDECFEFLTMELYTQDHPAFIDEVEVTWRPCDGSADGSAIVSLAEDMWVEVTAEVLGIPGGTLLKAMWFNGPNPNPNGNKFGLDNFWVEIVP